MDRRLSEVSILRGYGYIVGLLGKIDKKIYRIVCEKINEKIYSKIGGLCKHATYYMKSTPPNLKVFPRPPYRQFRNLVLTFNPVWFSIQGFFIFYLLLYYLTTCYYW